MKAHTPGPWLSSGISVVQAETGELICSAVYDDGAAYANAEANMHLVEKAPQLLEMLKTIIRAEFGRQDPLKFAPGTYWERAQRLVNEIEQKAESSPIKS